MKTAIRWRQRYNVLGILLIIHMISYMDRKAIFLVLPMIATEFDVGPLGIGLVSSIFAASYVIAQIPGGILVDKLGVRRVASLALLWWSAFIGLTGLIGSYAQLLVTRLCFGLGEGVYPSCEFKAITNWFPKNSRASAAATIFAFGNIGKALAPAVVLTAAYYWGWRSAFIILFFPGAVMAFIFWRFIAETPADSARISPEELAETADNGPVVRTTQADGPKPRMIDALRQPNVLAWFSLFFAFSIIGWAFPAWLPTYLSKGRQFSVLEMGLASTLAAIAGAAGSVSCGWLSDRYFIGRQHLLIIASQLLTVASVLVMVYADSPALVIAGATLTGFSIAFFYPAFWAMPMTILSKESMGLSSGVINMGGQLGGLLGPLTFGLALELTASNYVAAFWVQIFAVLMSCGITMATFKRGARQAP